MKKVTLLIVLLSIFTFACNQKNNTKSSEQEPPVDNVELVYHVEGMTCDHCEQSIQKGVNELEGISLVEANHEDSTAHIVYNPSKTTTEEIIAAIEKRGYHVVE